MSQRTCADCGAAMLRVPYMKDAHSKRVWLDRCAKCRAIWFDAGEPEAAAGQILELSVTANETQAQCPVCQVPLHEATLSSAPALACVRCRGVHLKAASLTAVSFRDVSGDDEPTLRPPPMFECVICKRSFSLDQGDGVTCRGCSPSPTITGKDVLSERIAHTIALQTLIDKLFG